MKIQRRRSGICDTCKTACANANLEFLVTGIFFFVFSIKVKLYSFQIKSVLKSHFNLKCSEAERIYKRGYQYKRREPDHIFLRWKKVGALFFLGAVCILEKVELLSVIRCMGIPQMLLIAFHLILHMPPFNDTKYLITPNITGIITHLCF